MAQPAVERLLSVEEFFALPDPGDGSRMELIDGRVVVVPPPAPRHGALTSMLERVLGNFVVAHGIGTMFGNCSFTLTFEDRRSTAVAPDVAFLASEHVPATLPPVTFELAPDLAVEVVSPSDRMTDVRRKAQSYLEAGSARVWVILPESSEVTVYRPDARPVVLGLEDVLTSEDAGFAAQGFALPLRDLFA